MKIIICDNDEVLGQQYATSSEDIEGFDASDCERVAAETVQAFTSDWSFDFDELGCEVDYESSFAAWNGGRCRQFYKYLAPGIVGDKEAASCPEVCELADELAAKAQKAVEEAMEEEVHAMAASLEEDAQRDREEEAREVHGDMVHEQLRND